MINSSFVGSKLEQTIRNVYMWYSVHIVKLKKFKTCIKQNIGEKISYSSRDTQVGKSSPSFDYACALYPIEMITLTKIIQIF